MGNNGESEERIRHLFQEALDCPLRLLLFHFRIFSFSAVATKLASAFPQASGVRFSFTVDVCVCLL